MVERTMTYPTDEQIEQMYKDYMSQFGSTEQEQEENFTFYQIGYYTVPF